MNEKFKKFELIVVISVLLVSATLIFKNPGITGFVSVDSISQVVDIKMTQSQSYILKTNTTNEITITSFRLSGIVTGLGGVEIFIEDETQNVLIYKNIEEKEDLPLLAITGMVIRDQEAPQSFEQQENVNNSEILESVALELVPSRFLKYIPIPLASKQGFTDGSFDKKCMQSCFIEMPLSSEKTYELVFNIEPDTILEINKITFTI